MNIVNTENINKNKIFYCYSFNLHNYLKYIKNIFPLNSKPKTNIKNSKQYYEFIRSKRFDEALKEWQNNKKNNTLVFKKREV